MQPDQQPRTLALKALRIDEQTNTRACPKFDYLCASCHTELRCWTDAPLRNQATIKLWCPVCATTTEMLCHTRTLDGGNTSTCPDNLNLNEGRPGRPVRQTRRRKFRDAKNPKQRKLHLCQ